MREHSTFRDMFPPPPPPHGAGDARAEDQHPQAVGGVVPALEGLVPLVADQDLAGADTEEGVPRAVGLVRDGEVPAVGCTRGPAADDGVQVYGAVRAEVLDPRAEHVWPCVGVAAEEELVAGAEGGAARLDVLEPVDRGAAGAGEVAAGALDDDVEDGVDARLAEGGHAGAPGCLVFTDLVDDGDGVVVDEGRREAEGLVLFGGHLVGDAAAAGPGEGVVGVYGVGGAVVENVVGGVDAYIVRQGRALKFMW